MSRMTRKYESRLREEPLYKGTLGASRPLLSPPYILLLLHPPCFRDNTQRPLPHSCPMTEVPPIPPGNQALAQAMSRSSTPRLREPASPSPVQRLPPPLAFLAEVFSDTRDSLQLDPTLVPNLTPQALHTISAGEGSTLSILWATVSGIVAITNQLDTMSTQLSALAKENGELHTKLHDFSSVLANEVASAGDLETLSTSVRDISYRVSAPRPVAHTAPPTAAPTAQKTSPSGTQTQARPLAPTAPTALTPTSQEQASADPATLDPSVHCPFYDTTLKKMLGNPELYALAFPHLWEAGQFCAGKYNMSIFTPATLHSEFRRKYLPTYTQAAGSTRAPPKGQGKQASANEVARKEDAATKTPQSLPYASRRFYAIRDSPAPHPLDSRIKRTLPDIVASTLTDSNCLLPKGVFAKVNDRGAVSLTVTDPHTPARSYSPYFDALTHHLNHSYPTGSNPWLTFALAPIAVQLAIHSIPCDVLPDDDDQLFPLLKRSIENAKETSIISARDLNKDRDSRLSKKETSLVVSVNPDDVERLLSGIFLFSERRKVERVVQANSYTQCTNSYRFGHASARCTQKHPTCPYCALHHTRSAHRCQNPTCPKGGHEKPLSGCCPTSPTHCRNCGYDHDAYSRGCRARPVPPPRPEAVSLPSTRRPCPLQGEDAMDMAADGHQAPSTPKAPAAPSDAVDLTTPHQPPRRPTAPTDGVPSTPTGGTVQPVTPSNSWVCPDHD